jgi:hypothetical protein
LLENWKSGSSCERVANQAQQQSPLALPLCSQLLYRTREIMSTFVTYSIKEMKTIKQQFENLANSWHKGAAEKLDEVMVAELKTRQPKLYKKLITDRTRIGVQRLKNEELTLLHILTFTDC